MGVQSVARCTQPTCWTQFSLTGIGERYSAEARGSRNNFFSHFDEIQSSTLRYFDSVVTVLKDGGAVERPPLSRLVRGIERLALGLQCNVSWPQKIRRAKQGGGSPCVRDESASSGRQKAVEH